MTANDHEDILMRLGAAVVGVLSEIQVHLSPTRTLNLADLIVAWDQHVARIEAELVRSLDDRFVWGADDFVAALYLRDSLGDAAARLSDNYRGLVSQLVDDIDNRLRRITERDEDDCIVRAAGETEPRDQWWWSVIPLAGPIRADLVDCHGHR